MKRYPTSLFIREEQTKTTVRCHCTPTTIAKIITKPNVDNDERNWIRYIVQLGM
jgi:hypothetical protein